MKKLALLILAASLLSGCSLMNPYYEDFRCKATDDTGRCVDSITAYKHATGELDLPKQNEDGEWDCPDGNCGTGGAVSLTGGLQKGVRKTREEYLRERDRRLTDLIKAPTAPLMTPPKVLEVLVAPYKNATGKLYGYRYAHMKVEDSDFVLGDFYDDLTRGGSF